MCEGGSDLYLGNIGKSVDKGLSARRHERYRLQDTAAVLLPRDHPTCRCGRRLVAGRDGVKVAVGYDPERKQRFASLHNVETCKNVWTCPVCSARISQARREEMNHLLVWARAEGLHPVLLTFTMRHGAGDRLVDLLSILKGAKKALHQSRQWRGLGVVGHVTATEVTFGDNGWHPHLHVLAIMPSQDWRGLDDLGDVWLRALRGSKKNPRGGDGNGHAYRVQDASAAGDYVAKWGAACEMTLAGRKTAQGGGRGVWQLLDDAGGGDVEAMGAWLEYVGAFGLVG
jgi:hypothetical protein